MKTSVSRVKPLLIVTLLAFCGLAVFGDIPIPDRRYIEVGWIHKRGTLIGLTLDECKKALKSEHYLMFDYENDKGRRITFDAGRTKAYFMGMRKVKNYIIVISFDKNGLVASSDMRWWP